MTQVPDPRLSRAVLIGVARYRTLKNLDAVHNNLSALAAALTSPRSWGLLNRNCVVVENPRTAAEMLDPLVKASEDAIDTLLLYYAGHGLLDRRGELHLTLIESDPQRIYTAVPYQLVRDTLIDSRASRIVIILDCCYSGRALGQMADNLSTVMDEVSIEGAFVLAATAENKAALAPPGERYTAFTGELIRIIQGGIAGRGAFLDLDCIYRQLQAAMRDKGFPLPQKRDRNNAGQLALIRNQAFKPEPQKLPEPHSGLSHRGLARPSGFSEVAVGFPRSRLGPEQRSTALTALAGTEYDVLIIGGGVVGTCIALDAITRGLSVGLVEARDFASGASSWPRRLLSGGFRDVEQLKLGSTREALTERSLLLNRIAPHLGQRIPFLYPSSTRHILERTYSSASMTAHDMLVFSLREQRELPRHRMLNRSRTLELAPSLKRSTFTGAMLFWDAAIDEARYVIALARTAAGRGARIASHVRVTSFLREGERVTGVRGVDLETGVDIEIRARQVVSAAGIWTDEIQQMVGGRGIVGYGVSKNVHLVVPRDRIRSDTGIAVRAPHDVMFIIPSGDYWIVGPTDTEWTLNKTHPAANIADVDYILSQVNRILEEPLTRDDVINVRVGLHPVLVDELKQAASSPIDHMIARPVPGLLIVLNGKSTAYRLIARDAIDAIAHGLDGKTPASCTKSIPLLGADHYIAFWNTRRELARSSGLRGAQIERMLSRYGTLIDEVLTLIAVDPSLGEPLAGASNYVRAEIAYAASCEGAIHLDDALTRRTQISAETWDRGLGAAVEAAEIMANCLGWDAERLRRELEYYQADIAAERASESASTDQDADAIRISAPDIHIRQNQTSR